MTSHFAEQAATVLLLSLAWGASTATMFITVRALTANDSAELRQLQRRCVSLQKWKGALKDRRGTLDGYCMEG